MAARLGRSNEVLVLKTYGHLLLGASRELRASSAGPSDGRYDMGATRRANRRLVRSHQVERSGIPSSKSGW